jgi:predicted MFS family arabinose efflux permease
MSASGWSAGAARRGIRMAPALLLCGQVAAAVFLPLQLGEPWLAVTPVCIGLMTIGVGVGITWPHLLSGILRNTPAEEQGLAASSISTVQLFAVAFGAALAGLIVNAAGIADPGGVEGAANAARWLFGCMTVAPLIALATSRRATRSPPSDEVLSDAASTLA